MQRYVQTLIIALAMGFAFPALACKFKPDTRPMHIRLNDTPIAFIGQVFEVTDKTVSFRVEHLLRGTTPSNGIFQLPIANPLSSCHIRFSNQQRWLFAGDTLMSPSMLLDQDTSTTNALEPLKRITDRALQMPIEWTRCTNDQQCRILPYGCSRTAVNNHAYEQAKAIAHKRFGRPETVNCINTETFSDLPQPLCVASQCGVWYLDEAIK